MISAWLLRTPRCLNSHCHLLYTEQSQRLALLLLALLLPALLLLALTAGLWAVDDWQLGVTGALQAVAHNSSEAACDNTHDTQAVRRFMQTSGQRQPQ
jgi:hypothetical protein